MASKNKFVVANWKMSPMTYREAKRIFDGVKRSVSRISTTVVIAPPFHYLYPLTSSYNGKTVRFGAQDVFFEEEGSHTGEISPIQLKEMGVEYVIVGHSERRALGEENEVVKKKLDATLRNKMKAILCIGESKRDREGEYLSFLKEEIDSALVGLDSKYFKNLIIAYEPIWAIGRSAEDAVSAHDMHQMAIYIRKVLTKYMPRKKAEKLPILYGGSVEASNATELIKESTVNGFLVGHASLNPGEFIEIIKSVDAN